MWDEGKCSVCGKEILTSMDFTKHLGANPGCRARSQVVHATHAGTNAEGMKSTRDLWYQD